MRVHAADEARKTCLCVPIGMCNVGFIQQIRTSLCVRGLPSAFTHSLSSRLRAGCLSASEHTVYIVRKTQTQALSQGAAAEPETAEMRTEGVNRFAHLTFG